MFLFMYHKVWLLNTHYIAVRCILLYCIKPMVVRHITEANILTWYRIAGFFCKAQFLLPSSNICDYYIYEPFIHQIT